MKFDFTTWRDRRGLDAMSVDFYNPDGESTRPYPGLQKTAKWMCSRFRRASMSA